MKRTLIWFLSQEGREVVFVSIHEGSPSQAFVTVFFQGQALPQCWDRLILTQGEAYSECTTGGKVACGRGAFYYSL